MAIISIFITRIVGFRRPGGQTMGTLKVICAAALLVLSMFPYAVVGRTSTLQEVRIKVKTELIQLRAVVTDRQGQLIDNLSKEDFLLLEDGRPQPIAFFSLERVRGAVPAQPDQERAPSPATGKPGARPPARSIPSRSLVLLVDTLHGSFTSLANIRGVLRQFLDEQMTDQDAVALVTPTGTLGVMEQFTQDRKLLRMGIEKLFPWRIVQEYSLLTPFIAARVMQGDPDAAELATQIISDEAGLGVGDGQGLFFDPRDQPKTDILLSLPPALRVKASMVLMEASYYRRALLSTLKGAIERLAEMPGQRIIAWFSQGFTMVNLTGDMVTAELQPIISQAARSGVVIYSFDSRGLVPVMVPAWMQGNIRSNKLVSYLGQTLQDSQDSMNVLAHETGGDAFYNTNDLAPRVQKMLADNQIYYELAYYPPQDKDPKKLRRITVSLKDHADYVVRAQRSYLLSELQASDSRAQEQVSISALQKAMSRPLPLTEIGVTALADFMARDKDQAEVDLQLQIQGEGLRYRWQKQNFFSDLELALDIYNLSGKPVQALDEKVQVKLAPEQLDLASSRGYRFNKRIALPAGLYHIRVGVRDLQSQRIGTAVTWAEVPDLKKGRLIFSKISLSDVATPTEKTEAVSQIPGNIEPREVNGLPLFKQGENVAYSCILYNAPLQNLDDELKMQLEIFQGERRIYQEPWFLPQSPRRAKDKIGLELSGQLKPETLRTGVFQTAQRSISFVVAP